MLTSEEVKKLCDRQWQQKGVRHPCKKVGWDVTRLEVGDKFVLVAVSFRNLEKTRNKYPSRLSYP